jgi:branched-chain amino acid transport system ATP-binding protein
MNADVRAPLLSCQNVTKRFGALTAVDALSFDVGAGEVLGIGGPNGAGKTTLFDVMSGVVPASSGRIEFLGQDITWLPPYRICAAGLARTFQLNAAFDSLTTLENVLCSAYFGRREVTLPKLAYDRETKDRVDGIIESTGLGSVRKRRADSLTVLQRKQLMIACALATEPALLLLDEPVGGLNPKEIDQTIDLIQRVRTEWSTTIVVIEHVMRCLVALCDRVMIMHHGRKIYEGSAAGVGTDPQVVEVYLGQWAAHRLQHLIAEQQTHA